MDERKTVKTVTNQLLQCGVPAEHNPRLHGENTVALDADQDAADRDTYEYALTLLHDTGDGGFVALTREDQQVVADAITEAVAKRRSSRPSVAWLCKRHGDGERLVPQGEECPACGATEPLAVYDRVRDLTQR